MNNQTNAFDTDIIAKSLIFSETNQIAVNPDIDSSYKRYDADIAKKIADCKDVTITFQTITNGDHTALFSLSDSTKDGHYFHIYQNGFRIGIEIRGIEGGDIYHNIDNVVHTYGCNTIALKIDSSDYTLKMFSNGKFVGVVPLNETNYRALTSLENVDNMTVGATVLAGKNRFKTTGVITNIKIYSMAISDNDIEAYTSQNERLHIEGADPNSQPFAINDDFNSYFFRIPALCTLSNGDIATSIDIRFASTFDSPNKLSTGIRFRRDGKWTPAHLISHFDDYSIQPGRTADSASFIDPAMIQDHETNRLYLLCDAFSSASGGGNWGKYSHLVGNGTVTVDGNIYNGLTDSCEFEVGQTMPFYFKEVENPTKELKYQVFKTCDNSKTEYTLNSMYEVSINGVMQTVKQKHSNETFSGIDVNASIFYTNSPLMLYPVGYMWLNTSDDHGVTWNDPQIICPEFRTTDMNYYLAGPGRGTVLKNGKYKGRVIFPVYVSYPIGERSAVIYSDDQGATWTMSEVTTLAHMNNSGKSSEAQVVEFADGTLRMFARGASGYIGYTDSYDGGHTFAPIVQDQDLVYASNVQVSAINYSRKINNRDVVLVSAPKTFGRKNGVIYVGLVHENSSVPPLSPNRYVIEWVSEYEVNYTIYSYSCLTELIDGRIGLLYESQSDIPYYQEFTIDQLMNQVKIPMHGINKASHFVAGKEATFTINTKEAIVTSLCDVENSSLTLLFPNTDLDFVYANFVSISEDKRTITYKATLPESNTSYKIKAIISAQSNVSSLDGLLTKGNVQSLEDIVAIS